MEIRQFDIWLSDLNPPSGTEPGKTRPVVVIQTNLLNGHHMSTLICPITIQVQPDAEVLRVHLTLSQLKQRSDVLVDQIRAIDNRGLIKRLAKLNLQQARLLRNNLRIVLDI